MPDPPKSMPKLWVMPPSQHDSPIASRSATVYGVDLRFPQASLDAALYESVYAVLTSPDGRRALWVRTTVRKRPAEEPTGAVWVTWFGESGVRAAKVDRLPVGPDGHGIAVGETTQGPAGSRGRVDLPSLSAAWDVGFSCDEEPLRHLRPSWLYAAPLPRTKSTSPLPTCG